jgi:hypothetical protein
MVAPFLLSRVLLRFNSKSDDLLEQLSAVTLTPDGSLWLGSDEFNTIERLFPTASHVFGEHQQFDLKDFIELDEEGDEIDIEGIDYANSYLWITGSHSKKRRKTKGKKAGKDIERLAKIETESNRFLIARIPVVNGELFKSCKHPDYPDQLLTAACLEKTGKGSNLLTDALKDDEHLGEFLSMPLPSKENGFDIEGLVVRDHKLFLGLRGPVLRGWAIILEIEVKEAETGVLILEPVGKDKRVYRKHFVDLNGLGIRELCWHGDDLIILAGPTMQLEGAMQVFRLREILEAEKDSLFEQDSKALEILFDLPFTIGSDHAEGMALFPCLAQQNALLVVYDSPDPVRRVEASEIFADVFKLPSR